MTMTSTTASFIFCTKVTIWKVKTLRLHLHFISKTLHFNRLLRIINLTFFVQLFFIGAELHFNFLSRLGGETRDDFICSTQLDKLSEILHRARASEALIKKNVQVSLKKVLKCHQVDTNVDVDVDRRRQWRRQTTKKSFILNRTVLGQISLLVIRGIPFDTQF